MRALVALFILSILISCSPAEPAVYDFLTGEWQVEGKEQFEVWEKTDAHGLSGYSYRMQNGEKKITETLTIQQEGDQVIYRATVPDQNDGATIPFILNPLVKDALSFENPNHDFPQKIQYRKVDAYAIEVSVSGEKGKGFSYLQRKKDLDL